MPAPLSDSEDSSDSDANLQDNQSRGNDVELEDDELFEWKKVDADLRDWIELKRFRGDYPDEYFSNPPGRTNVWSLYICH